MFGNPGGNEVRHGFCVFIQPPEVLAFIFAEGAGKAGAHWIDENQIADIEDCLRRIYNRVRRQPSMPRIGWHYYALGPVATHM